MINEQRSRNMSAVRGKNTMPELIVRRAAHELGLRFRLFRKDLPGRPDLTFSKWQTVIFVNGCFWHQHSGCPRSKQPKTNRAFWRNKLRRNVERDQCNHSQLKRQGWRVFVIWECEMRSMDVRSTLMRWFRH
jgi:DNA mismatch endonuclease (patch repair protein)